MTNKWKLTGDKLVKEPQIDRHEMSIDNPSMDYDKYVASLPSLPATALKGKFPDGEILEEGKDFVQGYEIMYTPQSYEWKSATKGEYDLCSNLGNRRIVAIPMPDREGEQEAPREEHAPDCYSRKPSNTFAPNPCTCYVMNKSVDFVKHKIDVDFNSPEVRKEMESVQQEINQVNDGAKVDTNKLNQTFNTPSKGLPVRPSLYAMYYQGLKEIAYKHGYNLCIHGSMNRDFDLVAFPWKKEANPNHFEVAEEMLQFVGGKFNEGFGQVQETGSIWYPINIWRNTPFTAEKDQEYYIDMKIFPAPASVEKRENYSLRKIRDYFGTHDKTPFEHWAFVYLDNLMKRLAALTAAEQGEGKLTIQECREIEKEKEHFCNSCGSAIVGWHGDEMTNYYLTCICPQCKEHNRFYYWPEKHIKAAGQMILPEYINRGGIIYKTSDLDIEKNFGKPASEDEYNSQPKI